MKETPGLSRTNSDFDVRIANGRNELAEAYELVYRSYRRSGYMKAQAGGIVYQRSFGLAGSRTIVASIPERGAIGTLTVVGDNPWGLQLETAYPCEMQSLRARGRNGCEITCLAIERTPRIAGTEVFFALTKFMLHHALGRGFDDLLMAIHPRHYRFYWRHYRTYIEGSQRTYHGAGGNPAIFCRIDLHYLYRNMTPEMRRRYFSDILPVSRYQGPQISLADHRYFCIRSVIVPVPDVGDLPKQERTVA